MLRFIEGLGAFIVILIIVFVVYGCVTDDRSTAIYDKCESKCKLQRITE